MNERRRGLGRGLGALIPTRIAEDTPGAADGATGADTERAGTHARPAEMPAVRLSAVETVPPVEPHAEEKHSTAESDATGVVTTDEPGSAREAASAGAGVAYFTEVPLAAITPNPRQPRQVFDEDALAELAHSLREVGVLQPVVVRELPAAEDGTARYELVMGERRLRAARVAGLETMPAIVRQTADDDLLRDALLENLHRSQLNPLEEAAAYDQLLADFSCTQEELAARIGRSRPQISNTLRLLRLPPEVQRRVAAGVLSAGHARALLGVSDPSAQERLAQRIVAEGLSVRTVEELVAMGELGSPERAPRRQHAPVAPALADLSARLSERFETRVKVDLGRRKGKITIEFGSIPDLERIVAALDPAPADGDVPHVEGPTSYLADAAHPAESAESAQSAQSAQAAQAAQSSHSAESTDAESPIASAS